MGRNISRKKESAQPSAKLSWLQTLAGNERSRNGKQDRTENGTSIAKWINKRDRRKWENTRKGNILFLSDSITLGMSVSFASLAISGALSGGTVLARHIHYGRECNNEARKKLEEDELSKRKQRVVPKLYDFLNTLLEPSMKRKEKIDNREKDGCGSACPISPLLWQVSQVSPPCRLLIIFRSVSNIYLMWYRYISTTPFSKTMRQNCALYKKTQVVIFNILRYLFSFK